MLFVIEKREFLFDVVESYVPRVAEEFQCGFGHGGEKVGSERTLEVVPLLRQQRGKDVLHDVLGVLFGAQKLESVDAHGFVVFSVEGFDSAGAVLLEQVGQFPVRAENFPPPDRCGRL